jgi:hypothetical protein
MLWCSLHIPTACTFPIHFIDMPQKSKSKRTLRRKTPAKATALQGRGGYLGDLWKAGRRFVPRAIGGAAGALTGRGAKAGWELGADFSKKILGWGDYSVPWSVSMNSLVTRGQAPVVSNVTESGVRLTHREYLGTLFSTTSFSNNVYYINPGLNGSFPWLSRIAANFQQYELMGAVITFKSALTDAVASFSSLGSVIIAADMNSAAAPATSQLQLEQMQFVASAKPSQEIVAPIECAPKLGGAGVRYIRTGAVPTSASILDYDHCLIQVATAGQPSGGVELGRLYISYDVKLLNPKMLTPAGSVASYTYTPVSSYPFGVAGPTRVYDTLGLGLPGDGTGFKTLVFPPGAGSEFSIDFYVNAGGDMLAAIPTLTLTNVTASTRKFPNNSNIMGTPIAGATTRAWTGSFLLKIVDPSVEAKIVVGSDIPFHATTVAGEFEVFMTPSTAVSLLGFTTGTNGVFRDWAEPITGDPDEEKQPDMIVVDQYAGPPAAAAAAGQRLTTRRP